MINLCGIPRRRQQKTLLFGGQKGGTGKSTLAINMALMAKAMEKDVLLVDTDKQGSAFNFISMRNERGLGETPPCVQLFGSNLHQEIDALAKKYDTIIIDSGGHDSVELRSAMVSQSVHHMYTPMTPSALDLSTLNVLDELVNCSKIYNPKLLAMVVFNQCPTHAQIHVTEDAAELVQQYENFDICGAHLCTRIALQYACRDFMSLVEYQAHKIKDMPYYQARSASIKASLEMMALYQAVMDEPFDRINFDQLIESRKRA